jgi:Chromatin remodeling factor Mit1 C-terminal Zn finger 2
MRDLASDDPTDYEDDIGPIDLTKDDIISDRKNSNGLHKPVEFAELMGQPRQIVKPITSLQTAIRSSPFKGLKHHTAQTLPSARATNPVAPPRLPPRFPPMDHFPLQRNIATSEPFPPSSSQLQRFDQYPPPLYYPPITPSQPQLLPQRPSQTYSSPQLFQQPALQRPAPTNSGLKVIHPYPPLQHPQPTHTPPPHLDAVTPPILPASQRRPPSPPKPPTEKPRIPVPHNPIEAETPRPCSHSYPVFCSLCRQKTHPSGQCPLRNEVLEPCPGCGFYHLHMHRSCPLLRDAHYVELIHKRLKESTEDPAIKRAAKSYMAGVRSDFVLRTNGPRPRKQEQKEKKNDLPQ